MPGLTVGLAVGIPSFVVLCILAVLQVRHKRREHRESGGGDDEIDIGLRDDASFNKFEDELQRTHAADRTLPRRKRSSLVPQACNDKADTTQCSSLVSPSEHADTTPRKEWNGSSTPSHSTALLISDSTRPVQPAVTTPPPQQHYYHRLNPTLAGSLDAPSPPASAHSVPHNRRPQSRLAYDFYDTMFPVIPTEDLQSLGPPNFPARRNSADLRSLHDNNSLEFLAKKLATPGIFDKVPPCVANASNVGFPLLGAQTQNNSQTNILRLVGESSSHINELYVFETRAEQHGEAHRISFVDVPQNRLSAHIDASLNIGTDMPVDDHALKESQVEL